MRRKMLFTIFKYLFSFQRYSNFSNMQISQIMMSTRFCSSMMKRDISTNLYQKCLVLGSKILFFFIATLIIFTITYTYINYNSKNNFLVCLQYFNKLHNITILFL